MLKFIKDRNPTVQKRKDFKIRSKILFYYKWVQVPAVRKRNAHV